MVREEHGNLLRADVDALVNTVNTVGVMGKGIALQFKRAYPDMFKEYERAAKANRIQVGEMFVWETGALDGPRFIVNFPTKRHWRSASRLDDIALGLRHLAAVIDSHGIRSIAIPHSDAGTADWTGPRWPHSSGTHYVRWQPMWRSWFSHPRALHQPRICPLEPRPRG
ncbi:macro domain-containing protein [Nocardia farcinica]|uniref:macro domain-containing protein n=1 Tax=Nocardia farcinica TaxID=37329 RepID=UPI0037A0EC41